LYLVHGSGKYLCKNTRPTTLRERFVIILHGVEFSGFWTNDELCAAAMLLFIKCLYFRFQLFFLLINRLSYFDCKYTIIFTVCNPISYFFSLKNRRIDKVTAQCRSMHNAYCDCLTRILKDLCGKYAYYSPQGSQKTLYDFLRSRKSEETVVSSVPHPALAAFGHCFYTAVGCGRQ